MAESKQWHIGSDMVLKAEDTRDAITGEYDNEATVTATMYDKETDEEVANAVNLPFVYQAGSDGKYYGNLPAAVTATLIRRHEYYMLTTIVGINYTLVLYEERPADYYP